MPKDLGHWIRALEALLVPAGLALGPWILAFTQSFNRRFAVSSIAFSGLAVVLAICFYPSISSAPAEGRGWYIIIYFFAAWIAYLVSLVAREKKAELQVET